MKSMAISFGLASARSAGTRQEEKGILPHSSAKHDEPLLYSVVVSGAALEAIQNRTSEAAIRTRKPKWPRITAKAVPWNHVSGKFIIISVKLVLQVDLRICAASKTHADNGC